MMNEPTHCINCGSVEHRLTFCPQSHIDMYQNIVDANGAVDQHWGKSIEVDASTDSSYNAQMQSQGANNNHGGLEYIGGQAQQPLLERRTFSFPAIPEMPEFPRSSTAAHLVDNLYKWGVHVEAWAQGFQAYAIQLREVTRLNCDPKFEAGPTGFKAIITLPAKEHSQLDVDNAMYRAYRAESGGIPPVYAFSATGTPTPAPQAHSTAQYRSQPLTPDDGLFRSGTLNGDGMDDEMGVESPCPRGRGARGRGSRARGRGRGRGVSFVSALPDIDTQLTTTSLRHRVEEGLPDHVLLPPRGLRPKQRKLLPLASERHQRRR